MKWETISYNKKLFLISLACVLISLPLVFSARISSNDEGIYVLIKREMPTGLLDYVRNISFVNSAEASAGTTVIFVNDTTYQGDLINLKEASDLFEHKLIDNEANVIKVTNGFAMPICMRDIVDGLVYGCYLSSGEIFCIESEFCPE